MQKFYMLILLLIFNQKILTSQNHEKIYNEIEVYFKSVEQLVNNYDAVTGQFNSISNEVVNNFAKKYFQIIENTPIEYNNYINKEYMSFIELAERQAIHKNKKNNPIYKRGIMLEAFRKEFGNNITEFLQIPYLLRVKIVDKNKTIYVSSTDSLKFNQTNILCVVEEVLKGKNRFFEKDTITISYLNWWLEHCEISDIEINNSYLLPVMVWKCNIDTCKELATRILSSNNCGIYLISNETIDIPDDFYQIGKKLKWETFTVKFKEKFIIPFEE